jgi:hypothetical protein
MQAVEVLPAVESLPRNIKIDWLRFQVSTRRPSFFRELVQLLGLPFEKKQQSPVQDSRETSFLAINKVWHEMYDFQKSLIGIRYPSAGTDEPIKIFVDLNGRTVSALDFSRISAILYHSKLEDDFKGMRIDVALDFPPQVPRLHFHNWESFVADSLIHGYKSVKRICNIGKTKDATTVYLGSRESSKFVRMYGKNIEGVNYDRLELEYKRERASWVMEELSKIDFTDYARFLDGIVCNEINFRTQTEETKFFKNYKRGDISVPPPTLHLDIDRSIAFIAKHAPTFAMLHEYMGAERYQKFMDDNLKVGKLKMGKRHHALISNANFFALGAVGLASFFLFMAQAPAFAGGLSCPAPAPLNFQFSQKFPIDIVSPNAAEQAYFNNIGDGCFQVNSGLEFQRVCLPGMIVNALRPFVIAGLGIKFIFSS